jgi:putative transposase
MAVPYLWRQLTPSQRAELLTWRRDREHPWHSPQHRSNFGRLTFHITAACFEHSPIIGSSPERLNDFSNALLTTVSESSAIAVAWCVLPNHYHALVESDNILKLIHQIGRFHGRTSAKWNKDDDSRGRKVFHGLVERFMRSDRHFWATLNYIHHNPVHHGYVKKWQDWPWSSATAFLEKSGDSEAERIWRAYPIRNYGEGWDAADL